MLPVIMDGERVAIVMLSAVGDAVHVLPVVTALKRQSPSARITWVVQPAAASLVRGHPAVDQLIVLERARGWRGFLAARRALRAERFTIVLDLQTYLKAGLLTAFARAPRKIGYDRARAKDANWLFTSEQIPPRAPQHVQDEYFEFLDLLGVPHTHVEWQLGPWSGEREWQREFFSRIERPVAALVIGSSKPAKDWVPERWAAVSDLLYEKYGVQPVLVGGRSPREEATERAILERARHAPISALDSGLRRLVGILDGSELVVSLDTGPLHIAVALDRPVISLIGYTDPRRTGPYRRFHDLIVDTFHDPGDTSAVTLETKPDRMARIQVSDVAQRIERWATTYRAAGIESQRWTPRKS